MQDTNPGELLNTGVQLDGREVSSMFKPGESFIEGDSEPHYVENKVTNPYGGLSDSGFCGGAAYHGVDQVIPILRR